MRPCRFDCAQLILMGSLAFTARLVDPVTLLRIAKSCISLLVLRFEVFGERLELGKLLVAA